MFSEKQYTKLLQWADDRLKKWNIPNLTGIDLIHEAWLIAGGNRMEENHIRKQAEKVLNDEVRHALSIERLVNGQVIVCDRKKDLLIPEEKKCGTCKKTKPFQEFRIVKGNYLCSDCISCEAEYRKIYKRRKYVSKKKFTIIDRATGKKYYSLPQACKDLQLKFSTVANYFRKDGHRNKTTLEKIK